MKKGNKEEKDSEKNINVRRLPVTPFPYYKICHSENLCWYKAREKYKTCHSLEHGGMQNKENQQGQQVQVAKFISWLVFWFMLKVVFVIGSVVDRLCG